MPTTRSSHFVSYFTGTLGAAAFLGAPQAEAAVTAVTFGFGSSLSFTDGTDYFGVSGVAGGTFGQIYAQAGKPDGLAAYRIGLGVSGGGGQGTPGWSGVSVDTSYGTPDLAPMNFLADGTLVGPSGTTLGQGLVYHSNYPGLNFSTNQLNKNIGFVTGSNNYGWANVSWDATAKALTVNSAYVESVPNQSIIVGDIGAVPEPSRALLALAGLGGVALRRRRKQAV